MDRKGHATARQRAVTRPAESFGHKLKHAVSRFAYPLVALLALAAALSSNS
jgi:hypothetical protein